MDNITLRDYKKLKQENNSQREQIKQLTETISSLNNTIKSLNYTITSLKKKNSQLTEELLANNLTNYENTINHPQNCVLSKNSEDSIITTLNLIQKSQTSFKDAVTSLIDLSKTEHDCLIKETEDYIDKKQKAILDKYDILKKEVNESKEALNKKDKQLYNLNIEIEKSKEKYKEHNNLMNEYLMKIKSLEDMKNANDDMVKTLQQTNNELKQLIEDKENEIRKLEDSIYKAKTFLVNNIDPDNELMEGILNAFSIQ